MCLLGIHKLPSFFVITEQFLLRIHFVLILMFVPEAFPIPWLQNDNIIYAQTINVTTVLQHLLQQGASEPRHHLASSAQGFSLHSLEQ